MATPNLYEFLESRGVGPDIIERMKTEKIDAAVVVMMEDTALADFIPLLGDRIAVRSFCTKPPQAPTDKHPRKQALLQKLRKKLRLRRNEGESGSDENEESSSGASSSHSCKSSLLKGNRNATSDKRKIDIGWLDFDCTSQTYKQVRKQKGGGTRQLSVLKTTGRAELLDLAQGLFFKDGVSSKGDQSNYEFDICDFRQKSMCDEFTVGQLYEESKMPILRFYLRTKEKIEPLESANENSNHNKKKAIIIESSDSGEEQAMPLPFENVGNEVEIGQECSSPTSQFDNEAPRSPSPPPDTPTITFGPTHTPDTQNQLDDTIPLPQTEVLLIRRGAVVRDMINSFSNPGIMDANISVHMILPSGQMEAGLGSGVYKDAVTQFWQEFYEEMTTGDTYKVPVIRHDFGEREWEAVARILVKGWVDLRYFPISLSPVFMETALFGSSHADTKSAFLQYIPESERNILEAALQEFPSDNEELVEILGEYDCKKLPSETNLSHIISEMGHKEIIQKPRFIADCMQPVLKSLHGSLTKSEFLNLYEEMQPSPKKVIAMLQFPPECTANEQTVGTYLKRYVRSLNEHMLKRFLRFCTGSDVLSVNVINVIFTQLTGFERRPIGHTCGNVLEVPSTYESFVDLRHEFNEILQSGVWVMDVI
ncbi:uncharacterized protein LOC119735750 [Patiria miniata]|uniref:HECT domain-containing protein n=1 Tax=Patiria miniata TaxID=46514 RepID=A0A914AKI2_PATMI|nr:uncharacterized protein LOC119734933 [Patiria miniata]XP_038064501.1 uncharacterized protein LOC119734933 [Patiria miniata]XP_038065594.1 uncharacterized protein LOC119735750 [Patiria miniata]XP_038065595.1 uncharacterized protein LOC119735750 [Patiria miniata]